MAINTHGSHIKVETNVNGNVVDNDEYVAYKARLEHTRTENVPWSQSYVPPTEEQEQQLKELYEKKVEVKEDPTILTANRELLKAKGIYTQ